MKHIFYILLFICPGLFAQDFTANIIVKQNRHHKRPYLTLNCKASVRLLMESNSILELTDFLSNTTIVYKRVEGDSKNDQPPILYAYDWDNTVVYDKCTIQNWPFCIELKKLID